MSELIKKLISGERITDSDMENELYEICDREHASCNDACPVYKSYGSALPYDACHKNGHAMLNYLKFNTL